MKTIQPSKNNTVEHDRLPSPDRSSLAKLYFVPKTYEQRQQERLETEVRMLARRPKYPIFYVALSLYVLVVLGIAIATAAPQLIMWNPISGVFLSFLLAMIFTGTIYALSQVMQRSLDAKQLRLAPFILIYLCVGMVLGAVLWSLPHPSTLVMAIVGSILHFNLVAIILKAMEKYSTKS